MVKLEVTTSCVTIKGIYTKGNIIEIPEKDLKLFSPDYVRIIDHEERPKTVPQTREKKTERKKAVKK